jgi:hypothetical protein
MLSNIPIFALAVLVVSTTATTIPRPPHTEHAKLARWLAHTASWGTLSSSAQDTGAPVG